MLAALPLGSGRALADPFHRTAELVALLELRRTQIDSVDRTPVRGSRVLRGLLRGRLSQA